MKKFLLVLAFLVAIAAPFTHVSAHEEDETTLVPTPTPTVVPYKLPYPGMLPDNKLYVFKVLRDKLILMLIADPESKAQYYLNLANKELAMSDELLQKKNSTLAKKTALKGEHEMTLMTYVFKNAKRAPSDALFQELMLASAKHQELLASMQAKASGEDAKTFQAIVGFSQRNQEELQKIYQGKEE